jgi:hypothetical protein
MPGGAQGQGRRDEVMLSPALCAMIGAPRNTFVLRSREKCSRSPARQAAHRRKASDMGERSGGERDIEISVSTPSVLQ